MTTYSFFWKKIITLSFFEKADDNNDLVFVVSRFIFMKKYIERSKVTIIYPIPGTGGLQNFTKLFLYAFDKINVTI